MRMRADGTGQAPGVRILGVEKVAAWLDQQNREAEKALNTALRVEGFSLSKALKQDIRRGAPGGKPLTPLQEIARRLHAQVDIGGGRTAVQRAGRKPLERLVHGVRYQVQKSPGSGVEAVTVGFVNAGTGRRGVSASWRRLAKLQQEGFDREVPEKAEDYNLRHLIIRRGVFLAGRRGQGGSAARYFFLRRQTRRFTTPARPIVEPFWQANRAAAMQRIRDNFRRKLAGERI